MSNKRKKAILQEKKARKDAQSRRQNREKAIEEGRIAQNGETIPENAVIADVSEQAPNNSYGTLWFYQDYEFACVDCGSEEVWIAEQQKWYYEVLKAPIHHQAVRCRPCRKAKRKLADENRSRMQAHLAAKEESNNSES